jgi:hypothetical protein
VKSFEEIKKDLKHKRYERKRHKEIMKRHNAIKSKVPYTCFYCELLGICRDETNNWKCRNGCMILNSRREYESKKNKPPL